MRILIAEPSAFHRKKLQSSVTPCDCTQQEEVALAEKRQELFTLFRNAAKVAPAEAGSFVAERLERVLADASAGVQDVEVRHSTSVGALRVMLSSHMSQSRAVNTMVCPHT